MSKNSSGGTETSGKPFVDVTAGNLTSLPVEAPMSSAGLKAELARISLARSSNPTQYASDSFDVAWSRHAPIVGQAPTLEQTHMAGYEAGMAMELARHGGATARQAVADAKLLLAKQPPAPPIIVGIGEATITMPPSLMRAARAIHESNPTRALQLFNIFCSGKKQMVSKLANKMGAGSTPFIYLNQTLFRLFIIDGFRPPLHVLEDGRRVWLRGEGKHQTQVECTDPEFTPADEGDPRGEIQGAMSECFGDDLRGIISRIAATNRRETSMSILVCLREAFKELDRQRLAEIEKCQQFGTRQEWAGAEDDSDD